MGVYRCYDRNDFRKKGNRGDEAGTAAVETREEGVHAKINQCHSSSTRWKKGVGGMDLSGGLRGKNLANFQNNTKMMGTFFKKEEEGAPKAC